MAALSAAGAFGLFVVTLGFTAVQKAIFSTEEVGTSKHPFSAMYESLSKLVSHCTSSWAMGLEYTLFFVLAFALLWCLFRMNLAGLKAKVQ